QALGAIEMVRADPILELLVRVELRLLRRERGERGFQPRELAGRLVEPRGRSRTAFLEGGNALLGLRTRPVQLGRFRRHPRAARLDGGELLGLGEDERHVLLLEAVLARLDLRKELE